MPLAFPKASSSSMKIILGACSTACANKSLTRAAPTPTNISTKSEPEMLKKGTPASPATARANKVLPRARRADQQNPFRNSTSESLIFLRILEKLHHLDQFFLRLIDAFDIREGYTGFFLDIDLRLALADLHQPAPGAHPLE